MYNRVIMVGNLTRDIELRYITNGSAIAKSSIATSHKYKGANGEQKEEVCFLEFSVFGRSAEVVNQYLKKGSKVLLEGRLVFEQWTGSDGMNRNRHSLRVENFKFMDSRSDNNMNNSNTMGGDSNYNMQQQNQNYQQNQGSYQNQNMQEQQYNAPQQPQQQQQVQKPEVVPEIDVDDDSIPF